MKRIITVIIGYAVMAWMIYLITVTARSTPKIWDPYDILGISRVRGFVPPFEFVDLLRGNMLTVCFVDRAPTKKRFRDTTSAFLSSTTLTRSDLTPQRTRPSRHSTIDLLS